MSSETRFSPAVVSALMSFGWFPGRKVDVAEYVQTLVTYDMPIVEPAVTAFREFGYLTIWNADRFSGKLSAPCVFDPSEISSTSIGVMCNKIGGLVECNASPVAVIDDMHPVFVCVNGNVFMAVYGRDIYKIGESLDFAIENNIVLYNNTDVGAGRI